MAAAAAVSKNTVQESPCLTAVMAAVDGLLPIAVFGFSIVVSPARYLSV
jgi:hypothetical protein